MVNLTGVNFATKKKKDGTVVKYHYVFRGGPLFWKSTDDCREGSPAYFKAYQDALKNVEPKPGKTFRAILDAYMDDAAFKNLRPRTQNDYKLWIKRIDEKFGSAPIESFNLPSIRKVALKWRNQWTGKQAQYGWGVLRLISRWAHDVGHLDYHHLSGGGNVYQQKSRAGIIWTDADIAAFNAVAPAYLQRVLTVALETGLRRGDLIQLSRFHDKGSVIEIRTSKRSRVAHIPITPTMRAIFDSTPSYQRYVLVNSVGDQLNSNVLSQSFKRYSKRAGLDDNLRLNDCRGTAVTNWVLAKVPLDDIAKATGWSIRTASQMIDTYAALHHDPDRVKGVLHLLQEARK